MNDVTPQDAAAAAENRLRLTRLMVQVATAHDKAAFTELFAYFAPRVKGFLMRMGARGNEAEELAQDVMVTVWQRAATFDAAQASAGTWIYTIARNRRIDALRRAKRPEIDPNDPLFIPEAAPAPDAAAEAGLREERVRAALTELPAPQRDLLQRAFYDGKTHSEIAEATGLPLGTVKSRLRLAFGRLRKALDGDSPAED